MKKIILIVLCFVLVNKAMAQNNFNKSKIKLGINTGLLLNRTKQEGYTMPTTSNFDLGSINKFGFRFGIIGNIRITNKLNFIPELNFIKKNSEFDYSGVFFSTPVRMKGGNSINFIELPLNFTYNLGNNKNGFYIGLGPVLSLGVSGSGNITLNNQPTQYYNIKFSKGDGSDNTGHLKPIDFGANVLIGYKFNETISVNLAYNNSFINLAYENQGVIRYGYFGIGLNYYVLNLK